MKIYGISNLNLLKTGVRIIGTNIKGESIIGPRTKGESISDEKIIGDKRIGPDKGLSTTLVKATGLKTKSFCRSLKDFIWAIL